MLDGTNATISWEGRDGVCLAHCTPQWPEQCLVECEILKDRRALSKHLLNEYVFSEGPATQLV